MDLTLVLKADRIEDTAGGDIPTDRDVVQSVAVSQDPVAVKLSAEVHA